MGKVTSVFDLVADGIKAGRKKLKAYHGSPHDMPAVDMVVHKETGKSYYIETDRFGSYKNHPVIKKNPDQYEFVDHFPQGHFDSSKIGTGEGAQAYGRGLYFAEREGTAVNYRDQLTPRDMEYEDWLMSNYKEAEAAQDYGRMEMYERAMQHDRPQDFRDIANDTDYDEDYRALANEIADEIDNYTKADGTKTNFGRMYEVDIDASPDELLDYDLPLSEQPEIVMEAIRSTPDVRQRINMAIGSFGADKILGRDILEVFAQSKSGGMSSVPSDAAEILKSAGVKGVKYADAQTRFSSKGKTSNYVIFDDKLIQIARKYGVTLPVASAILAGAMTPEQAQAGFFSQAVKAAQNLTRKTGNAQGFKNDLTGKGQVKPDELKAMGFDEHFGDRTDITKEEVQQFINDNQINIEEVQLGRKQLDEKDKHYVSQHDNGLYGIHEPDGTIIGSRDELEQAQGMVDMYNASPFDDTSKFGKYTLDNGKSGENYRELLMTLPTNSKYTRLNSELTNLYKAKKQALYERNIVEDNGQLYTQEEYDKVLIALDQKIDELDDRMRDTETSMLREVKPFVNESHFSQDNVLAHLRMKDRVDADGNKTLMLEEVQSDWHQQGKEDGYRNHNRLQEVDKQSKEAKKRQSEINNVLQRPVRDPETGELTVTEEQYDALENEYNQLSDLILDLDEEHYALTQAVPDAPFKSDDKSSWYNLAMKRGLIEAAEGDYDKLAFTTGRQQADRYSLSQRVGEMRLLSPDDVDSRYSLLVKNKEDNNVLLERLDSLDDLKRYVGREYAQKLIDQPIKEAHGTKIRSLKGDDLEIGGGGMKEFYDRKLPNTLNKLVKQDGVKVGQTELAHPSSGTELNRDGFTRQEVAEIERLQDLVDRDYASSIDREYLANYLAREKPYGDTVHSIDITPEMRDRVKKGLPLFAQGGLAVGGGALFAPKDLQAAEYNEAPVIEEQSFGDMVNEYGQINRNLKALEQQKFDRLMAEDEKLRSMGSASFGKVSPELAAYRRSRLLPSLGNMAVGAVDESLNTLDFLSNLPRAVATMQWNPTSPLQDTYGEAVRSVVFGDERDKGALDEERFVGGFLGL
jgi:hypothetical protein